MIGRLCGCREVLEPKGCSLAFFLKTKATVSSWRGRRTVNKVRLTHVAGPMKQPVVSVDAGIQA